MLQDTRDPSFVFDLSSSVLAKLPLPVDILRVYALEFEIKVERALMDLMECLREAIKDKDCYWELAETLMEDIEEMSSAHKSEFATHRAELDRRGLALLGMEAEYVQLRSLIVGLENELADLTQRFATLDHT